MSLFVLSGVVYGASSTSQIGRTAADDNSLPGGPVTPLALNAKDFGIVGDGVTNDATALRALLSSGKVGSGGHIHFPCGTYLIGKDQAEVSNIGSNHLTISGDGRCTHFVGRDATLAIPNDRGTELWNIFEARNITGLVIKDLSWEGYLTLLDCINCIDVQIDNVIGDGVLANAGQWLVQFGLFLGACYDVKITNSQFYNFNDAIYFSGDVSKTSPGNIITGNHFEHTVAAGTYLDFYPVGVYIFFADDVLIANNSFKNIYSSFDDGDTATGMGYGVYVGDGVSKGVTITDNDFLYTGNGGLKNATAIANAGDNNIIITGNNIRSVAGRLFFGILLRTDYTNSIRIVSGNVLTVSTDTGFLDPVTECCRPYAIRVTNGNSGLATQINYITVSKNLIKGPWENGIKVTAEPLSTINIIDNEVIGGVQSNLQFDASLNGLQRVRIAGNRLLYAQNHGIEFWDGTVRAIIENNTILDGNLANASGDDGMAIRFRAPAGGAAKPSDGVTIRNNVIGNTPVGGGKFTGVASNAVSLSERMFKDRIFENTLTGFNLGASVWVNYPTASPTAGFYDVDFGDIINNVETDAGEATGWVCTKASLVVLTADASNFSTTITVADTTGYAAGDLIMLSKTANPYWVDHGDLTTWHATTIASVTNGTTFVITDAIPLGDGTYVSGTGQVKRAVFKPLAVVGS